MKQTIELEGSRKATVEIPIGKLTAQSTQYKQNNQSSECCQSKIIMLGCGRGCGKSKQSNIQMAALAQLQEAYDRDVSELNDKIKKLEKERDESKLMALSDTEKMRKECDFKVEESRETLELLRAECKKKDKQIAELLNQKEIIVRNKLIEFRQNQYFDKIRDLQNIIKLKDAEIQEFISKVEILQLQKMKSEELRAEEQIKWERQLSTIKAQFSSLQSQYSRERVTSTYASKVRDEDNTRVISDLRSLVETSGLKNRQLNGDIQKIRGQNARIANQKEELKGKILKLQQQISDSNEKVSKLKMQNEVLIEKISKSEQTLYYIESQKGQLLLEIQSKYAQIQRLKTQLNSREKVYEVKIQRVIDGKAQIQQMQLAIFQLEQQLKQLNSDKDILAEQVKRKEIIIKQQQQSISKYIEQISSLKAYIEKREGSFKWVVEREIEKDIVITQTKPQIYKVSQVNEYTREISVQQRNILQKGSNSKQVNMKGNLQQIILTGFFPNQ